MYIEKIFYTAMVSFLMTAFIFLQVENKTLRTVLSYVVTFCGGAVIMLLTILYFYSNILL